MRDELADAEKSLPIETDEQRRRGFEFGIAELKTRNYSATDIADVIAHATAAHHADVLDLTQS